MLNCTKYRVEQLKMISLYLSIAVATVIICTFQNCEVNKYRNGYLESRRAHLECASDKGLVTPSVDPADSDEPWEPSTGISAGHYPDQLLFTAPQFIMRDSPYIALSRCFNPAEDNILRIAYVDVVDHIAFKDIEINPMWLEPKICGRINRVMKVPVEVEEMLPARWPVQWTELQPGAVGAIIIVEPHTYELRTCLGTD